MRERGSEHTSRSSHRRAPAHLASPSIPRHSPIPPTNELLHLLSSRGFPSQHDHACACAPHWLAIAHPLSQRLEKPATHCAQCYCRRLSSWDDEAMATLELLGGADGDSVN